MPRSPHSKSPSPTLGCRRWPSGSTWCSAATKISTSCQDRPRLRQSRARTAAPNLLSTSVRQRHSLPIRRIPCEMAMRRRSRCGHGGWRLRAILVSSVCTTLDVLNPSQREQYGVVTRLSQRSFAASSLSFLTTIRLISHHTIPQERRAQHGAERSFGFSSFVVFRSVQAVVLQY